MDLVTVTERRDVQRYALELPCLIQSSGRTAAPGEGSTRDLSSSGAYLLTSIQIRPGRGVDLDIVMHAQGEELPRRHFRTRAIVVRQEGEGLAVHFNGASRITPVLRVIESMRRRLEWLEQQGEGVAAASVADLGPVVA
jgi:hypothetical protein